MKGWKRLWVALCGLALVIGLAGQAPAASSNVQKELIASSTIEQALKRGSLKIGFDIFAPWAMKAKTGEFIGFEIDVATKVAKDMGLKPQFVPTKWSGIIPALLTGKFDVIIGGMSVRPERNLKVNFTIPYDYAGQSIVAHKEKAKGFKSLADFNKPEVIIAARLGATPATAAKKYLPKAKLRLFDNESQAIQELLSGRVHAVVASAPLPAFTAIKHSDKLYLPFSGTFTKEPIGFAVRKGDWDTLNYFNNWIRVNEADGWLQERKLYWFESRDWEKLVK